MESKLVAERRGDAGKGVARKLRAAGRVPGVLYGHGERPIPLSVDARDMVHLLHSGAGSNVLLDLVVDGKQHLAMPREIQRDHIHNKLIHVDFLSVSRDEKIAVSVEIVEIGDAPGVKEGGVVEHHLRELRVECLPQDVPERIEADISNLQLGDMLHVRDLVVPHGIDVLTDPDEAVLSVVTPAILRVEAELEVEGEEVPEGEAAEAAEAAEGEAASQAGEEGKPETPAEEGGEG